ncbi:MAG: mannitol dehydrogenase family protein, partial [Hyphomicrobiales bacterium]
AAYANALLTRYANPAIRHRTWQIAMDGSQKLPQRILGTLRDNLSEGRQSPGLGTAVAAWMIYVGGTDLNGNPIDVRDPLADTLRALSDAGKTPGDKVAGLLSLDQIFDVDMASAIRLDIEAAYILLTADGVRTVLEDLG